MGEERVVSEGEEDQSEGESLKDLLEGDASEVDRGREICGILVVVDAVVVGLLSPWRDGIQGKAIVSIVTVVTIDGPRSVVFQQ